MMYSFSRFAGTLSRLSTACGCRYPVLLPLLMAMVSLIGCGKSPAPSTSVPQPSTLNPQPSFRLHWLGKKRLVAESNATNFVSIWNMPESVRLEGQTLDKLATAPWRLLTTTPLSNAPSALLRPLLDDLVQEESYLEISAATNQSPEIILAIKLPADRLALWQTNLPAIFKSLQPSTFNLQPAVNANGWTLLSISPSINTQHSTLNLASRLSTTGLPFTPEATNFWISGRANLSALSHIAGWNFPASTNLPVCEFSAIGESGNVRTFAKLTFPTQSLVDLQPWNIPTNLVADPVVSFTAFRDFLNCLKLENPFDNRQLGISASQFYGWTLPGIPVRTYFAFPSANATNWVQHLKEMAINQGNEWLQTNAIGTFVESRFGGLGMSGVPFSSPFVRSSHGTGGDYVFIGTMPIGLTNRPMSTAIVDVILSRQNLVYYDWELSSAKMEAWSYFAQLMRVIFRKAQMPRDSAGHLWLRAVTTNLTTCATLATKDSSEQISAVRRSSLGFTAGELQLIVDWLESPDFPQGFHTTRAAPKQQLNRPDSIPTNKNTPQGE